MAGAERIYLPTGTYSVRNQINLSAGQAFYGDAESTSVMQIVDSFDPAATSVNLCTRSTIDPDPTIRDLNITLRSPTMPRAPGISNPGDRRHQRTTGGPAFNIVRDPHQRQ